MNEDKIMDKINKNLKIIDSLLMENGFYKYISKVVNIEDGTSQLYDNLKHLQQENEELKKQIENKYKKVGTLTNEILYEENTKLQQENARLKDKIDMAIKYYEANQQECVIGRNKDDKLIKEYYLPAQCSKKMLDILKKTRQ